MMNQRECAKRCKPNRQYSGFTLVEVLIVVTIIGILAGLMMPAIISAVRKANEAKAYNELSQISLALEGFKQKYGVYPPSRIRLRENDGTPATGGYVIRANGATPPDPFDVHSYSYLKRIWPQINLKTQAAGAGGVITTGEAILWYANGVKNPANPTAPAWNSVYDLEGDECLVFFLAGIATQVAPGKFVMNGFSKNPKNPGGIPIDAATMAREDKFYDFDSGRLFIRTAIEPRVGNYATDFSLGAPNANKLPSYRDLYSTNGDPKPIAYFSGYEGRGYRPHDCNIPSTTGVEATFPSSTNPYPSNGYQVLWPQIWSGNNNPGNGASASLGPNPYTETNPAEDLAAAAPNNRLVRAFKPTGFQLFTAGRDLLYGEGGQLGVTSMQGKDFNSDNINNLGDGLTIGAFNNQLISK